MKPFLVLLSCALLQRVAFSGPTENAIIAAMSLSDVSSYAWTSSVTDDAGSYVIEGKTQRSGYTWLSMPMIPAVELRLGRDSESRLEVIFGSSELCVLRTSNGWKLLRELPSHRAREASEPFAHGVVGRTGSIRSSGFGAMLSRSGSFNEPEDRRPVSNLQLGVSRPHEELAVIVSTHETFQAEGEVVSGTLSDLGAQLLLVRDGTAEVTTVAATGTFKLWLKGNRVTRYQLRLAGVLILNRRRVHVHELSTTSLHAIGATHFDVPAEARAKLPL